MQITVTATEGPAIIELEGSFLGGKDSTDFADAMQGCFQTGKMNIVIDLARLDFMNSSGLGAIFAAYSMTKRAGGCYAVANGQSRVLELFRLTKTDTVIPVHASIQDAIEFCEKGA